VRFILTDVPVVVPVSQDLRPYLTHQVIELPEIAMTVIHFILYRALRRMWESRLKGMFLQNTLRDLALG